MKNNKSKTEKKEILPIEKDKKQASEIKREQKDFEKLFEKCVNVGTYSQAKIKHNKV
jgi:hypothetical protein